jgi:hypothetical protein
VQKCAEPQKSEKRGELEKVVFTAIEQQQQQQQHVCLLAAEKKEHKKKKKQSSSVGLRAAASFHY